MRYQTHQRTSTGFNPLIQLNPPAQRSQPGEPTGHNPTIFPPYGKAEPAATMMRGNRVDAEENISGNENGGDEEPAEDEEPWVSRVIGGLSPI